MTPCFPTPTLSTEQPADPLQSILRTRAASSGLLLLILSPAALAVPITAENSISISNTTTSITTTNTTTTPQAPPRPKGGANITSIEPEATVQGGSPNCKPQLVYDLCTASNAKAYCDSFGTFHSNYPKTCVDCWCQ
ncbi:hypothetical protein B0H67DRAFT_237549 [Lasiosphaeris hirsuta]|uniref:ShKT domain-containing protein n=1 Tax=Lasiosphaeris hirsuta TaxID=260670 RepID=A0AA40DXG0_9PEZI|nr:hypothetical protein B0H67DRAFT_237549 [Lasiosphaeris hirsuta]